MAYATLANIIALYSERALYVADRDGDGAADEDAVENALTAASAEIDAYVGALYTLPLTSPSPILTGLAVDIALYKLALSADVLSEEHRRRYEDARALLKDIAQGRAVLGPADQAGSSEGSGSQRGDANSSPRPIIQSGPERAFTRDKMRGL